MQHALDTMPFVSMSYLKETIVAIFAHIIVMPTQISVRFRAISQMNERHG